MTTIRFQQVQVPPGVIDLGVGQPESALLPVSYLRRAAELQLANADPVLLQYGAEWGDGYLRLALARYLSRAYRLPVDAEHLFSTNGNSQALDLLCTIFTKAGDTIFVEEPTYFFALNIFEDYHLKIVGIPVDEAGMRIDALEAALKLHRPAFVYTIPAYQNPTGFTLSMERRQRMVELSQQHGFLIAADEVYQLLHYAGQPPPPPMSSLIDSGTVLSLGTFSKILAPGFRLGWIHAVPALLEKLVGVGMIDSGGGLNPVPSIFATAILNEGWQDEYLAFLLQTYGRRVELMDQAIREHLPAWVEYQRPSGGYFFWLRLPEAIDAVALRRHANTYKIDFRPGPLFSSHKGLRNYLRLSFAYYNDADCVEGVARLGRALKEF